LIFYLFSFFYILSDEETILIDQNLRLPFDILSEKAYRSYHVIYFIFILIYFIHILEFNIVLHPSPIMFHDNYMANIQDVQHKDDLLVSTLLCTYLVFALHQE
jgi:hypothetical protein